VNFIDIPLASLIVNPSNDRHGPKGSEQSAINWLFAEHPEKMVALAADIVRQGRVFDAPLVVAVGEKFIVFDGNRRITCLKAICGLCDVPDELKLQFLAMRKDFDCAANSIISCQIEHDQAVVDQVVSRRHNGTDNGRGQLGWDTRAKQNHAKRIGVATQYPIAEAIEDFLSENGYPHSQQIKRSTLFRLFSSKQRQKKFRISLENDGNLRLLAPKEEVLPALVKIAKDIVENRLTLKNVLNSDGVKEYMAELAEAGYIEDFSSDERKGRGSRESSEAADQVRDQRVRKRPDRINLIPDKLSIIEWPSELYKAKIVWEELQFSLNFKRNTISIPVLFRVLIEIVTESAIGKIPESKKIDDKLSVRIGYVADYFLNAGHLTKREKQDLERLIGKNGSPRELEALHRCAHSTTALPAKEDLIALWTGFEKYLLLCIRTNMK
jgi:hypothetical protein